MLTILREVEIMLPRLLANANDWNSVFVDYHLPFVERVWRQWGEYRIMLHQIYPCAPEEALWHPHPWPSAMKIESGRYEMGIGFRSDSIPAHAGKHILAEGDTYEMVHPDGWHYVCPLDGPSMSLMVTGKPWNRVQPVTLAKTLRPLSEAQKARILSFFCARYVHG
ncbi:MAG: hypothetical protein Q8R40_06955 [bacterium]|nr:hypothetical protein [bacterium]